MSKLDPIQEHIDNDLRLFKDPFFENMDEIQVVSQAKGPAWKGRFYRVPDLDYFNSWYVSGIVGGRRPSTYSESPWLWNTYFRGLGVNGVFFSFDLPIERDFNDFFRIALDVPEMIDLTVTDPYKSAAFLALEQVDIPVNWSEQAKRTQTVNHILVDSSGPQLIVLNTDGIGMLWAVKELCELSGKRVLIIGAGGSSVSIGYEFVGAGCDISIINRTLSKAEDVSRLLATYAGSASKLEWGGFDSLARFLRKADIVINTVPEGCPIDNESIGMLKEGAILAETKYGPKADLKEMAFKKGLTYIDGRAMLFGQFVEAAESMCPLIGVTRDSHKEVIAEMKRHFFQ